MSNWHKHRIQAEVGVHALIQACCDVVEECPRGELSLYMADRLMRAAEVVLQRVTDDSTTMKRKLDITNRTMESQIIEKVGWIVKRTPIPEGLNWIHVDKLTKSAKVLADRLEKADQPKPERTEG